MIKVRRNVFETNSSSTHAITMCLESDYNAWRKGDLFFCDNYKNKSDKNFFTFDEMMTFIRDTLHQEEDVIQYLSTLRDSDVETFEDELYEYDFYTFDMYPRSEYYETYSCKFTPPEGKTIVAFGYYGES